MALNTDQIRVAGNGRVYVAPKGTALPTDLTALAATYVDLGAVHEDGATISRSADQETVNIWQSTAPARYLITSTTLEVQFTLMQFNADTLPLYFGGGEVTTAGGVHTYSLGSSDTVDERVLVIDMFDGGTQYRYAFGRAQVTETDEITLSRSEASGLALTFGVMADGEDGSFGAIISNDTALAA